MKLNCKTADLKKALNRLSFLPGGHTADVISGNLHIEAGFDGALLKRRSTGASLSVTFECEIEEDGETVIAFDRFKNFIGNAKAEAIELALVKGDLHVNAGAKVKIATIPDFKFSPALETKGPKIIEQAGNLAEWITALSSAYANKEQMRAQLEGLVFETVNGRLWMCASDGRRAHAIITNHELEVEENLPRDSSDAIKQLAKSEEPDADIIIRFGDNCLGVSSNSFSMTCNLGSEATIKVAKLLQVETTDIGTIDRVQAYDASVEASAFVTTKSDPLEFVFDKKALIITKSDTSGNSFEKTIECKGPKEPVNLAFNWDYFTDALAACRNAEVKIENLENRMIMIRESDRAVVLFAIRNKPVGEKCKR